MKLYYIFIISIVSLYSCVNKNENKEIQENTLIVESTAGSIYEINLDSPDEVMTYQEALDYAKNIGNGWRLPESWELIMLRYNGGLKAFDICTYWSSTIVNDQVEVYNFYIDKKAYEPKSGLSYIKLIRNVSDE
jgi:hypothetical protein